MLWGQSQGPEFPSLREEGWGLTPGSEEEELRPEHIVQKEQAAFRTAGIQGTVNEAF